jgi:VWFA-related protein
MDLRLPLETCAMGRFVAILAVVSTVAAAPQSPQGPVFRGAADNVPVFVTVTDKSGRLVPDLTRSDFQVFDNGKPQPITVFDNSPQPIRVIVLIDASGSMSGNLSLLRGACEALIDTLAPSDLARVGTFGETISISPVFTNKAADLVRALPAFIPPNAPTPLWTTVDRAIGEFGSADGRRVVLVMSDGKDSGPRFGQKWVSQLDVTDRAEREDVMIYGIGMRSRGPIGGMPMDARSRLIADLPDPGLGTAAEETGGGYFELRPRQDLAAVFADVTAELHHQYLVGFVPPTQDHKTHKLEVKTLRRDTKVRARKTYRAR